MRRHPELYYRDCQHCLKYIYNLETGKVEEDRDGNPIERPRGSRAPCQAKGDSCPKGTPDKPRVLNRRNELAYAQFQRCRVTGRWPENTLVEERAVLLAEIEDLCRQERISAESQLHLLMAMQAGRLNRGR